MSEDYRLMAEVAKEMLRDEKDLIANLANLSAVINSSMKDLNWAGFYRLIGEELVLGPFQGMPACIRIPMGKGVCGTAAKERKTIIVRNVHDFPGHIACDANSNSEIAVPIFKDGKVWGVLDVDSPLEGRFTELEGKYLDEIGQVLSSWLDEQE